MGRTVGALGPAPAAATEGSVDAEGPAVALSASEDPTEAGEGPVAGGEGPWRTRGVKV